MEYKDAFLKNTLGWQQLPENCGPPLVQNDRAARIVMTNQVVVVVNVAPTKVELDLLNKIMGAVGVSDFQIVEDRGHLDLSGVSKCVAFGLGDPVPEYVLAMPSLSEFFSSDPEKVKMFKKDAWDKIRRWHNQAP